MRKTGCVSSFNGSQLNYSHLTLIPLSFYSNLFQRTSKSRLCETVSSHRRRALMCSNSNPSLLMAFLLEYPWIPNELRCCAITAWAHVFKCLLLFMSRWYGVDEPPPQVREYVCAWVNATLKWNLQALELSAKRDGRKKQPASSLPASQARGQEKGSVGVV